MNPDIFNPRDRRQAFKAAARATKVEGLLRAITLLCARRGSPVGAAELITWNENEWDLLAMNAGVNLPSVETRSLVMQHVAEREAAALAANERRAR